MTETKRPRKKDGPRTEVFAMRLDPKLKYLAEIASRKQRRSLANFIEWAIEEALGKVMLDSGQQRSVLDEAPNLWRLEPADRLIKLAETCLDLMTYEEQRIWLAINEVGAVYPYTNHDGQPRNGTYAFFYRHPDDASSKKRYDRFAIRACWKTLVAYSSGQASEQDLRDALTEAKEKHKPVLV